MEPEKRGFGANDAAHGGKLNGQTDERYREFVEMAPASIYVVNRQGRFVFANAAAEKSIGLSREELTKLSYNDPRMHLLDSQGRPFPEGAYPFDEVLRTKAPVMNLELSAVDAGGVRHTISVNAAPVLGPSGDVEEVVFYATDITDQKAAGEKLKLYREIFLHSQDAVSIVDLDGRYVERNLAHRALTGYTDEDLKGRTPAAFMKAEHAQEIEKRLRRNEAFRGEFQLRTKDGRTLEIDASAFPVSMPDDTPAAYVTMWRDITERKRAEEELRLRNVLLATQLEAALDGILVVGESGEILSFNRKFVEMWGISADVIATRSDDLALKSVLDNLVDPRGFMKGVSHLYAHRSEFSRDELALKDGRTFDRYSAPMIAEDGRYYGRVWYFRDMTGRKQMEDALWESEKKVRALLDQTFEFIGVLTPEGILTEANETALKASGLARSDVIGKPFWEAGWWTHSPELQERLRTGIRAAAAGEFVRFEATHPAADGRLLKIDFSLKPVKDDSGRVTMLIPEGRDVTEQRDLEQQVRLLARIVAMSPDPMAAVDEDDRLVSWNKAAEKLFGHRADEVLGRTAEEILIPPDKLREVRDFERNVLTHPESVITDLRTERMHKDGTRIPVGLTLFPLFDESGRRSGRAGVFHDLRGLLEMEKRLVKQSKLAAVGQLAASLVHEIRNPLFGISSIVEILAREVEDRPAVQELARSMQHETERLKKLLGGLLLFARPHTIQREPVNPQVIGIAVHRLFQSLMAEKEIRLEQSFAPADAEAPIDRELIHQVLLNLYLNAIESSPAGGVICVRSRVEKTPRRWTFEISNRGETIRAEDSPRIFDPFFTTKAEGTGLGLAICRKIVEEHDGEIRFTSTPEAGTTFSFVIPIS